jgi:epoxyqueuosine reductase QueG
VVTTAELPVKKRPYSGLYEYCTFCGACMKNCPVNAISPEEGKKHPPCSDYLDVIREKYAPRYGCGKCQVKVPCRDGIPPKIKTG